MKWTFRKGPTLLWEKSYPLVKYEYEEEMEGAYRSSLLKSFKKNIDGGYFPFLIGILHML